MDEYTTYLEEKITFLEKIIENLMDRFDRGGTLPSFPDFPIVADTYVSEFF